MSDNGYMILPMAAEPEKPIKALNVNVDMKVDELLERIKKDTGKDKKDLVAFAVYLLATRPDIIQTFDGINSLRDEFEEWVEEEELFPSGGFWPSSKTGRSTGAKSAARSGKKSTKPSNGGKTGTDG